MSENHKKQHTGTTSSDTSAKKRSNKAPLKERIIENREIRKETEQKVKAETEKAFNEAVLESEKIIENRTPINDVSAENYPGTNPAIKTATTPAGKKKHTFWIIVIAVICIASLVFTALNDFSRESMEGNASFHDIFAMVGSNWQYFVIAILCALLIYFVDSLRTSLMLRRFTNRWQLKLSVQTTILTKYYDNITPFASGGQPFAIYNLHKHGVNGGIAAAIPITSIYLMQMVFISFALGAFICDTFHVFSAERMLTGVTLVMGIVGIVSSAFIPVAVIIFSSNAKIGAAIIKFFLMIGYKLKIVKQPQILLIKTIRAINNYISSMKALFKGHKFLLLAEIGLSVLLQIANCSLVFFTLKSFGYNDNGMSFIVQWLSIIQWCMILYCVVSFIPTPGNSGASELTFNALFGSLLLASTGQGGYCFPAIITWRFLCFYGVIIAGALITFIPKINSIRLHRRNKKTAATADMQSNVNTPKN